MRICETSVSERREVVETWIEQFTTRLEEACRDVAEQVDRWETRTAERCDAVRSQVCSALPWPFSLLCNWVVSVVCWIVTTVVRVVATVIRRVCELVATVIRTLKRIVSVIVTPIITVVCILFVSPRPMALDDDPGDLRGVKFERRGPDGVVTPFLWGVATAAAQVEGGIADNDWERFTGSPSIRGRANWRAEQGGSRLQLESPGRATDHWDLAVLAEDLDRAEALGLNAYRFSIEWSRVQPEPPAWAREHIEKRQAADARRDDAAVERELGGEWAEQRAAQLEAEAATLDAEAVAAADATFDAAEFDAAVVQHYRQMVELMRERGLEPILTLHHMSLPEWVLTPPIASDLVNLFTVEDDLFRGSLRGWENDATVKAYAKLVRFLVPLFRDDVRWWVTINEPVGSMTATPYLAGIWPPGFLGDAERARRVYRNLVQAHVTAYDTVKELAGDRAQVGFSHWVAFPRRTPQSAFQRWFVGDNEAAKNQWDYAFTLYFLDAVVHGHDNPDIWRKHEPAIRKDWRGRLDFLAPQYYRAVDVYHDKLLATRAPWAGGQFKPDLRSTYGLPARVPLERPWVDPLPSGALPPDARVLRALRQADLPNRERDVRAPGSQPGCLHARSPAAGPACDPGRSRGHRLPALVLVDNWEWAFGFQEDARFGLFGVDRGADPAALGLRSLPRHITEGALAYQYLIENSGQIATAGTVEDPFAAAVERFGTFTGDGRALVPPARQHGAIWTGSLGDGGELVLYLTRLSGDARLGMLYAASEWRWHRLEDIRFDEGERQLSFRHRLGSGDGAYAVYTARVENDASRLVGTVDRDAERRDWRASRDLREGVWRFTGAGPSHLAVSRLEAANAPWLVKLLGGRDWAASGGRVTVAGADLTTALGPRGSFVGRFAGRRLSGTRTAITRRGTQRVPWSGERLPEDAVP